MQSMEQEGTGRGAPNWDLFQLLSLQSMTSFMTTTRERVMSHEEFSFLGEERGEGGILLKAQFLLQVSYKKMKEYSKVLLCKGKT